MLIRMSLAMLVNGLMLVAFTGFPIAYMCTVYGVMQVVARVVGVAGMMQEDETLVTSKVAFSLLCLLSAVVNGVFLEEKLA